MRSRTFITLLAVAAFACGLFIVRAQQPDDEIRGAFLGTRPKSTNTNAPARRHRASRNTNSSASSNTAKNANTGKKNTANSNAGSANKNSGNPTTQAIGLGYTLFMRDSSGRGVRVDPGYEFHYGDRVRISLEPNVDGYLYVFNTTDNGAPVMIYPDARLDNGNNEIEAHVPLEVPSREAADERSRWFQFDKDVGVERIYLVVTREPLGSVPISDALVLLWSANKSYWRPTPEVWAKIQEATRAEVKVVTSKTFGQAQTDKEKNATTRGLGLDQSAPEPSIIRMNAATNSALLVAMLDLVHK